jgi:hypothetical protein
LTRSFHQWPCPAPPWVKRWRMRMKMRMMEREVEVEVEMVGV